MSILAITDYLFWALAPPTPLEFVETALAIATAVLQMTLLFLAIRLYRADQNAPFRQLMWACVCYVVPRVTQFLFFFIQGYLFPQRVYVELPWWIDPADQILLIVFLVLMMRALRHFIREREPLTAPHV